MNKYADSLHKPSLAPLLFACLMLLANCAFADLPLECGSLKTHFGPFDYRSAPQESLRKVEKNHFDNNVANLRGHAKCGKDVAGNCTSVSGDLGYTLRALPNHHGALLAMARYHLYGMDRTQRPMIYSAECWFRRAIEFTPDDPSVRMLYAYFLSESGNIDGARSEYVKALELAPNSAEINYNAGLFFLETNDLGRATECATRAYELGHPLPGLRKMLLAKGIALESDRS